MARSSWAGSSVGLAAVVALLAVVGTFALAGARATNVAMAQSSTGCSGAVDISQPIETTVGRPITIALPANATTGYEWFLSQPPDPSVAQVVSAVYIAPTPANPPVAGQGGVSCWTFVAVGPGQTEADFAYRRPFQLDETPPQTASVQIIVDDTSGQ